MKGFVLALAGMVCGANAQNTIPPDYALATKLLAGKGLESPKGGQFSQIKYRSGARIAGNVPHEQTVYGWVMPGSKKFVGLDGFLYPYHSVDKPAQISDMYRALSEDKVQRQFAARSSPPEGPTETLPALLLLRGEVKVAESCFDDYREARTPASVMMANRVIQHVQARTVALISGRKDREALKSAKILIEAENARDQICALLPPDKPQSLSKEGGGILAEVERRLKDPKPMSLEAIAKLPKSQQVLALIDLLDETHATMISSPGGSFWSGEKVFDALVKLGDVAVIPILDAIDNDRRFTRSVVPSRHMGPSWGTQLVRTKTPLTQALLAIWPAARTIRSANPEGTDQLRRAWKAHQNLSAGERWAQIIRDVQLTPLAWSEAAKELPRAQLSVETRDEVAHWLAMRAIELTGPRKVATAGPIREAGYGLALAIARHELLPTHSAQVLNEVSANALTLIEMNPAFATEDGFLKNLATVISIRMHNGDKDAPAAVERLRKIAPGILVPRR